MASVFEIVKQSGRIPLDELTVRSSETAVQVTEAVRALQANGVVAVTGTLPADPADSASASDTVVSLPQFKAD